jgi:uncharacterized repeat protein (TIGR01451 family)
VSRTGLSRRARSVGAGLALLGLLGVMQADAALAVPAPSATDVTLISGSAEETASWDIANDGGTDGDFTSASDCDNSPGLTVEDADYEFDDGDTTDSGGDAFDNGLTFWIGDEQFAAPAEWDVEVDDATPVAVSAGPTTVDGLEVEVEYRALPGLPVLRSYVTLANDGTEARTIMFTLATNVGADSSNRVLGSSSGDRSFTTADRWVVTADHDTEPDDPINTHVLAGPDDPAVLPNSVSLEVFDCADPAGVGAAYEITIPAGSTRSVLFFNELNLDVAESLADATRFDVRPSNALLTGIPVAERGEIVNWELSGTVTKAADAAQTTQGGRNGFTVSVNNPTSTPAAVSSIVDTLPAGFSYVAGSSTVNGVAVADPSSGGQVLTWTGPFSAPGDGAAVLKFAVNVSDTVGSYVNRASASSTDLDLTSTGATATVEVVAAPAPESGVGYRMVAADGGIFTFGDRQFHGSTGDMTLNKPIVGGATDVSDNDGYWIVASDGGVFTFNAPFFGSLGAQTLSSPAVEIEPTPTGKGYWIVLADGKVHAFGDAKHFGDMSGRALNKPVIGMSVTPSGMGYWLVAEDGGIFNFGDAGFFGSMGDKVLNAPVIDLAPSVDNQGYYLLGRDGGVFTFGSADFKGSTGNMTLNAPVIAMLVAPNGAGYWLAATDGGVFTFGSVPFLGSMGGTKLNSPVLDLIS